MVPMRFEFVYEDVARELGVLAEDGVGARRPMQLTGHLGRRPPSARTAEWYDAFSALVGAEVKWPRNLCRRGALRARQA
ncbi:hypothetical protein FOA52_012611 [Chlamydomonas sp. UWO 241]|nr:hypothetical protein FOA52_012611 [Chlamydomonas sp. UWO 241]